MVRNGLQRHDGRWWNTEHILGALATYYGINKTTFSRTWRVRALVKHYWCKHPDYIWYESWPVAIKRSQVLVFEATRELPSNVMTLICPLIRSAEMVAEMINNSSVDETLTDPSTQWYRDGQTQASEPREHRHTGNGQ